MNAIQRTGIYGHTPTVFLSIVSYVRVFIVSYVSIYLVSRRVCFHVDIYLYTKAGIGGMGWDDLVKAGKMHGRVFFLPMVRTITTVCGAYEGGPIWICR